MLEVVSLENASALMKAHFGALGAACEFVPLNEAAGRAIACDVVAEEGVPPFDRSTVDGFAVVASDTFGCSEALPALLELAGEIDMGAEPPCACSPGVCLRIPTGGKVPAGADAVVMLEYCEEYGDGTVGIGKSVAPGDNIVFENDDVKPGQVLISARTVLQPHHIGTLASIGQATCEVRGRLCVGIISTGDEIIDVAEVPVASQMRDVNAPMLAAAVEACGAQAVRFPIVPDDYDALLSTVDEALTRCDVVLVSGGSSAGQKDNTARVLRARGEMLFHGVAVKPGKPTMCADVAGKPVVGLPGHPVAAYFMFLELVRPLLVSGALDACEENVGSALDAREESVGGAFGAQEICDNSALDAREKCVEAVLAEGIPSNHGRSEIVAVRLKDKGEALRAIPIRNKSGLISQLSPADGYLIVGRNQEGLAAGTTVLVKRW